MARRRRHRTGLNHPGTMGHPFVSRAPRQGSIRQGTHPVEAKKTLAERGLEERNSASRLLEGETFVGEVMATGIRLFPPSQTVPSRYGAATGRWNHYAPPTL